MAPVEVTFWEPVKAKVGSVDEQDLKDKKVGHLSWNLVRL